MLFPALRTSLAVLLLRAGPQDMPFDTSQRLQRETLLFALICHMAFWALVLPVPAALALAAVTIAAKVITVRVTLAARHLPNRFQQTLTALLMSNALLTVVMLPFFDSLAPHWKTMFEQLQQQPDLMNHPEKLPLPPPGPTFVFDLIAIWKFIVSVRVFGAAADVGGLAALFIAALCVIVTLMLITLMSPLINVLTS